MRKVHNMMEVMALQQGFVEESNLRFYMYFQSLILVVSIEAETQTRGQRPFDCSRPLRQRVGRLGAK